MSRSRATRSKHASGTSSAAAPGIEAVAYARVSTKDQEKEGYSIPAQLGLLRDYASKKGYRIVQEFTDAETGGKVGRTEFTNLLALLKARAGKCRVLLVEKTDRLYRNFRDYTTLDELDIEVHLVKENVVLCKDSRSSEKFMHGIRVLMARNYLDNLSEEVRKGHQAKAEAGVYPSVAPIGYRNVMGSNGKRVVVPDPEVAPFVALAFERFASGRYSLDQLAKLCAADGLVSKGGKRLGKSQLHHMLHNPMFMGEFDWRGKRYQGTHVALVDAGLFERVQAVLTGRWEKKSKTSPKHQLAYAGLITCGHCGCALVGDIKKEKYVYYRCSHNKGKCPEPYVREEALTEQFKTRLAELRLDADLGEMFRTALRESHVDKSNFHEQAVAGLQADYDRLEQRINAAYVDKLDGKITTAFFEEKSGAWRTEQQGIRKQLERHEKADASYMETGIQLFELAQGALDQFVTQDPAGRREIVEIVCSNSSWANGKLSVAWTETYAVLAATSAESGSAKAAGVGPDGLRSIGLPESDSKPPPWCCPARLRRPRPAAPPTCARPRSSSATRAPASPHRTSSSRARRARAARARARPWPRDPRRRARRRRRRRCSRGT